MMAASAVKLLAAAYQASIVGVVGSTAVIFESVNDPNVTSEQITISISIFVLSMAAAISCTWKARGLVATRDKGMRDLEDKIKRLDRHIESIARHPKDR